MLNCIIYRITNKINGKVYIGQTRRSLGRRKSEHIHRFNLGERDHKLYLAMRKYGVENFEFDTVCCALSADYLDELEVSIIADHNSFNRGYNMTCGGDSISEETRKKLSLALTGRKAPWVYKSWITRRRNGTENPTVQPKGAKHPLAKRYLVRHPNGRHETIAGLKAFCRGHALTFKAMYDVLAGKQNHHKGYALLARFND